MSNVQALAQALTYLDGQSDAAAADPDERAAILIAQLADRGYVLRPPAGSTLQDQSPANLLAARRQLGLRAEDVAREAGVHVNSIRKAEDPAKRPQGRTTRMIAAALDRLAAGTSDYCGAPLEKNPPVGIVTPRRLDRVAAMNHLDPEGALSGLDLSDHEGLAIRAALDVWGTSLDPPRAGNAAIRAALREYLIAVGLWPAPEAGDEA